MTKSQLAIEALAEVYGNNPAGLVDAYKNSPKAKKLNNFSYFQCLAVLLGDSSDFGKKEMSRMMTMKAPKPSEVIETMERARRLVSKGWCRKSFSKETASGVTQFCAVGAAMEFRNGTWASVMLEEYLHTLPGQKGTYLTTWNDRPSRKQKEVVKLYTDAIKWMKKSGREAYKKLTRDMYDVDVDFDVK